MRKFKAWLQTSGEDENLEKLPLANLDWLITQYLIRVKKGNG